MPFNDTPGRSQDVTESILKPLPPFSFFSFKPLPPVNSFLFNVPLFYSFSICFECFLFVSFLLLGVIPILSDSLLSINSVFFLPRASAVATSPFLPFPLIYTKQTRYMTPEFFLLVRTFMFSRSK
jgi:hypothetical protein